MAVAWAGCGDDGGLNRLPDAPLRPDAATSGPVQLVITSDGEGIEGVTVHFQNADSSLVATVTTDASGLAEATMEPGGFVTAVDPFPEIFQPTLGSGSGSGGLTSHELRTFSVVQPGDTLVLARRFGNTTLYSIEFEDVGAQSYELYAPCVTQFFLNGDDSKSPGIQTTVDLDCGETTDVTIVGRESKTNNEQVALFVPGVELVTGETISLDGSFVDMDDVTLGFTDVPEPFDSVNVEQFLATTRGTVFRWSDFAQVIKGAADLPVRRRPVIATATEINVAQFFGTSTQHTVIQWGEPLTSATHSVANLFLGEINNAPAYGVPGHSIGWTAADGGATPDFATASLRAVRDQKTFTEWTWQIAAPLTPDRPTAIEFPILPGEAAELNPTDQDSIDIETVVLGKVPGGYDTVRERVFTGDLRTDVAIGAEGVAVLETLDNRRVQLGRAKPKARPPGRPTAAFVPPVARRR